MFLIKWIMSTVADVTWHNTQARLSHHKQYKKKFPKFMEFLKKKNPFSTLLWYLYWSQMIDIGGWQRSHVHEAKSWRRCSKGGREQPGCQVRHKPINFGATWKTWKTWKTLKTFLPSLYEIGSVVSSPGPEPDPPIWKIYDGICKQDRKVHGMEIEWVSFILHTNELWLHPEEGLLV